MSGALLETTRLVNLQTDLVVAKWPFFFAPGSFAISPNDRTVAFAAGTLLYVLPLDGSMPPSLIFEPTHAPVTPSWSPDSRFIAFARFFGGYGRCP